MVKVVGNFLGIHLVDHGVHQSVQVTVSVRNDIGEVKSCCLTPEDGATPWGTHAIYHLMVQVMYFRDSQLLIAANS
jgi:hypothetical protein